MLVSVLVSGQQARTGNPGRYWWITVGREEDASPLLTQKLPSERCCGPFPEMGAWIVLVAGILTSLSWDEAS